ncbi:hypothetical protein QQP08_018440 [Theobroma cacao]|nr:hypothetical protein QQP08_018440 [Theobroma cacao]
MNLKKVLSEEIEVVRQLDVERRSFKEGSTGRRPSSPPIHAMSSFVFQPLDEYWTSLGAPMDDPDVWRPPSQDTTSRRPVRAGEVGMRNPPEMGLGRVVLILEQAGGSSRTNTGVRASATGKKDTGSGKSSKEDSANGDAEDGKSKRLQYEGPDPDLAAMLERDVLETTPGVQWDDVAGLTEAKRLLEKAFVLPLWMWPLMWILIKWLVEQRDSGDDLTNVCRDASLNGMRRKIAGKTWDEIRNMSQDGISKDPVPM